MSLACANLLADMHHIGRLSRLEALSLPIPHSCDGMTAMVPHLVVRGGDLLVFTRGHGMDREDTGLTDGQVGR